jgi:autotransporter-associated beta strand protein
MIKRLSAAVAVASLLGGLVHAQTWDGGSPTTSNWNDPANWNPNAVPGAGANIIMAGTARTTNIVNQNFNINSLTFSNTAGASSFTINNGVGNTLTIGAGGILNNDPDVQSINVPLILGASQTWDTDSSLIYGSIVTLNGNQLTIDGDGNHSLTAGMTGAGSIVKNGTGVAAISLNNPTFTGGFTLNAGTVTINSSSNALGTGTLTINGGAIGAFGASSRNIANNAILGGNLSTTSTFGTGGLSFAGTVLLTGNRTITADNTTNATVFSGVIGQDIAGRGLTKQGAGTLLLSGTLANAYTGTTTVNEGTLRLQKTAGMNAVLGAVVVGDGAGTDTLQLGASDQIPSSGAAQVTVNSSGVFDLATFSETILPLVVNGGSVMIGTGSLTIDTSLNMTSGSISSTGAGSLLFRGNLTTNAATTSATISGNMNLGAQTNNYTIAEGTAINDLDISATVTNGGITKLGDGTMRLSGSGVNTAGATINAGTLVAGKSAASVAALAGNVTVGDGLGGVDADILRLEQDQQINQLPTETLTVNSSGWFDLAGRTETIGNLQLNAGRVAGGTISFDGSVTSSAQTTSARIESHIDMLGSTKVFTVNDGTATDDLVLTGALQSGSFTKTGNGTLRISGSSANTASLFQAAAGILILEKDTAIDAIGGSSLIISDGAGGPQSDIVRYGANDHQLPDIMTVTVSSSGLLDLNGRSDTIGGLVMNGGVVQTGAGTLTISNQVASVPQPTSSGTINGNLNLAGGTRPFDIANGPPAVDLTVTAAMSNGTLQKQGAGTLALTGAAQTSAISYQLDDGELSASGLVVDSAHSFTQNGGTFSGTLDTSSFTYNGGTFNGRLINRLAAGFNADFTAANGMENLGGLSAPTGRTLTFNGAGLDNEGAITFDGGTLAGSGPLVNFGLIQGNGTIAGSGGFTNNGQVNMAEFNLVLSNSGPNSNTGAIDVTVLLQLSLSGGNLANTGQIVVTGGSITGTASLLNQLGGQIIGDTSDILTTLGGGSVLVPLTNSGGLVHAKGTNPLTIANLLGNTGGGELRVDDGATLTVQNSFVSSGTIVLAGANSIFSGGTITNTGTLRGQGRVNNVVVNNGAVRAENGTLTLAAAGHTNAAAGRIEAGAGAQVLYSQGLATNSGQIALTGGAFDNNNVALANPGRIEGHGTLRTGGLTNTGTISVGGGDFDVLGAVTQNAVVSTQSNSTARFFGPVSGPGSYSGPGTVEFLNTFSPGASPAEIMMSNFILGGSATLIIELGGTAPGSQYDKITASGTAALGGTLDVDLIDGFTPEPGDVFQFITAAGGVSGSFTSASLPALDGASWHLKYNPNSVLLQVAITGDYNADDTVNAADYTVWRNSLHQSGPGLAADGNGDNMITHADFTFWKSHYGETLGAGASLNSSPAVPEPAAIVILLAGLACVAGGRRRR